MLAQLRAPSIQWFEFTGWIVHYYQRADSNGTSHGGRSLWM